MHMKNTTCWYNRKVGGPRASLSTVGEKTLLWMGWTEDLDWHAVWHEGGGGLKTHTFCISFQSVSLSSVVISRCPLWCNVDCPCKQSNGCIKISRFCSLHPFHFQTLSCSCICYFIFIIWEVYYIWQFYVKLLYQRLTITETIPGKRSYMDLGLQFLLSIYHI